MYLSCIVIGKKSKQDPYYSRDLKIYNLEVNHPVGTFQFEHLVSSCKFCLGENMETVV